MSLLEQAVKGVVKVGLFGVGSVAADAALDAAAGGAAGAVTDAVADAASDVATSVAGLAGRYVLTVALVTLGGVIVVVGASHALGAQGGKS